jgi:hypothetical protein
MVKALNTQINFHVFLKGSVHWVPTPLPDGIKKEADTTRQMEFIRNQYKGIWFIQPHINHLIVGFIFINK